MTASTEAQAIDTEAEVVTATVSSSGIDVAFVVVVVVDNNNNLPLCRSFIFVVSSRRGLAAAAPGRMAISIKHAVSCECCACRACQFACRACQWACVSQPLQSAASNKACHKHGSTQNSAVSSGPAIDLDVQHQARMHTRTRRAEPTAH